MSHGTLEQWLAYVEHRLSEGESDTWELHLEACDACMELYIQSLELASAAYPLLLHEAALADNVMKAIQSSYDRPADSLSRDKAASSISKRWSLGTWTWTRHPLFHYTVAASITMLLMGSGLFQSIAVGGSPEEPLTSGTMQAEPAPMPISVSQQLLDKTIVMLDAIQPKHERGGSR
ncbi:hypothetical protein [Paenibacillus agricola]|uniref:Zinc finger protein n=1 Tax=Paenibacillus agricola TaxID=2716264 RepID=A0ABX0JHH3_9BACL|nr:hypothetical protein [Paenibacillus agricola]NHN33789.1 hypothetical protein [Paenibacillus agricola]